VPICHTVALIPAHPGPPRKVNQCKVISSSIDTLCLTVCKRRLVMSSGRCSKPLVDHILQWCKRRLVMSSGRCSKPLVDHILQWCKRRLVMSSGRCSKPLVDHILQWCKQVYANQSFVAELFSHFMRQKFRYFFVLIVNICFHFHQLQIPSCSDMFRSCIM